MEIRNIAGMSTQELMACISEKKNEMEQKLKNGETEPTFSIGARSYTVKEWDKLIDKVDRNLDAVRKEQEQRREAQEKEALEEKASDQKEFLSILENSSVRRNIFMEKLNGTYKPAFPYEHLAKNGVISYHGVEFVCDAQKKCHLPWRYERQEKCADNPARGRRESDGEPGFFRRTGKRDHHVLAGGHESHHACHRRRQQGTGGAAGD